MDIKKINYKNLLISILILGAVGYIYNKFKLNVDNSSKMEDLNIIKTYLLNDETDNTMIEFINKHYLIKSSVFSTIFNWCSGLFSFK